MCIIFNARTNNIHAKYYGRMSINDKSVRVCVQQQGCTQHHHGKSVRQWWHQYANGGSISSENPCTQGKEGTQSVPGASTEGSTSMSKSVNSDGTVKPSASSMSSRRLASTLPGAGGREMPGMEKHASLAVRMLDELPDVA